MTPGQLFGLFRKSLAAWNDDDAASMGAAIAYYTLFSIAPLLVMVIALASLIVGRDAAYGAAGSMVILMIWVYYSAQVFLLGAEFTWVYAYRHGSRANEAPPEPPPPRRGRPVNAIDIGRPHGPPLRSTRRGKKVVARK